MNQNPFAHLRSMIFCTVLALFANDALAIRDLRSIPPSFHSTEFILALREEADGAVVARQIVKALLSDAIAVYDADPAAAKSLISKQLKYLINSVDQVQFRFNQENLLVDGPLKCASQVESQWLLQTDNPLGRYPLVAWRKPYDLASWSTSTWQLLLHETISALGVVDDSYQVSAAIMDVTQFYVAAETEPMEFRQSTPRFTIDQNDQCYDQDGVEIASSGSLTGIGGAGDSIAMAFKRTMVIKAEEWWQEKIGSSSTAEFREFRKMIVSLGFEPLDKPIVFKRPVPTQMVIGQSRRSKRVTVKMDYRTGELWGFPMYRIYQHVYEHWLKSKDPSGRSDLFSYGEELAAMYKSRQLKSQTSVRDRSGKLKVFRYSP